MNCKLLILVLVIVLTGCASKDNFIVLMPSGDGEVGALQLSNNQGDVVLDQQGQAVYAGDRNTEPSAPVVVSESETRGLFSAALDAQPRSPESFLLYFEFDSTALTEESSRVLAEILTSVGACDSHDLSVIGHTDRAGDYDYNLQLSLQRASVVRDMLVSRGVNDQYLQLSSHGEGNPLIQTADDVAEPRNRRVEVVIR